MFYFLLFAISFLPSALSVSNHQQCSVNSTFISDFVYTCDISFLFIPEIFTSLLIRYKAKFVVAFSCISKYTKKTNKIQ